MACVLPRRKVDGGDDDDDEAVDADRNGERGEDSDDEIRVLEKKVAKTAAEPGRCSSTSTVHGRS